MLISYLESRRQHGYSSCLVMGKLQSSMAVIAIGFPCYAIRKPPGNSASDSSKGSETKLDTHVIAVSFNFLAGLPSGILSTLTGVVFAYSLTISYKKALGASVLSEPEEAWDRETLYPALSNAEIVLDVGPEEALKKACRRLVVK